MADLDVSDLLLDPDFTDIFDVIRRTTSIGTNGRQTTTPTRYEDVVGVITVASSSDLMRHPEVQLANRSIMVVSKFRLQGVSTGLQPDLVEWRNSQYIVRAIDPYPQFGQGFTQALCESIDLTDPVM